MAKKYYLPLGDKDLGVWLSNLAVGVAALPAAWGTAITGNVASLQNDAAAFNYELLYMEAAEKFFHSCVANKDALLSGPNTGIASVLPVFNPPAGAAPTAVKADIVGRVIPFVQLLKQNTLYTAAIGEILKVIGDEITFDPATAKPTLKLLYTGGHPLVKYNKSHTEGLYLFSMRGSETAFSLLTTITKASYVDARPNLVIGQAETREYMGFYKLGDVQIGLESDVVKITV